MKRFLVIGLFCLLIGVSSSSAQSAVVSGVLRGLVGDRTGAVMHGAKVSLTSATSDQHLERFTNSAGAFIFPALPVGTYALEVSSPGFRNEIVPSVDIEIGQTTVINFQLVPGGTGESITVTGESPLLRSEDSSLSSVINRPLIDNVPLSGRRFLDLALLVPNASPDGEQGLVSFAGEQGGQDTGYANANGANSFTTRS